MEKGNQNQQALIRDAFIPPDFKNEEPIVEAYNYDFLYDDVIALFYALVFPTTGAYCIIHMILTGFKIKENQLEIIAKGNRNRQALT